MRRPSATSVLLVGAATARATAIALVLPSDAIDPRAAVLVLDVAVPTAIAAADHRGWRAAPTAAIAYGSLGAATLLVNGLAALTGELSTSGPVVALLVGAGLAMLAAATAIGRFQDHGAPAAGSGPRSLRAAAVLGAALLGAVLVTRDVAVLGAVPVPGGTLPGPIGVATTMELRQVPLLVGALLPMAWAVTRRAPRHLRAVGAVLGPRAVVEAVAGAAVVGLGGPVWPTAAAATAAVLLLLVVPALVQATSSSA